MEQTDTCIAKKDCFAYIEQVNSTPGCIALSGPYCERQTCPFYKTAATAKLDTMEANKRRRRLGYPEWEVDDEAATDI